MGSLGLVLGTVSLCPLVKVVSAPYSDYFSLGNEYTLREVPWNHTHILFPTLLPTHFSDALSVRFEFQTFSEHPFPVLCRIKLKLPKVCGRSLSKVQENCHQVGTSR